MRIHRIQASFITQSGSGWTCRGSPASLPTSFRFPGHTPYDGRCTFFAPPIFRNCQWIWKLSSSSIHGTGRWLDLAGPYLHWFFVMTSKRTSWQIWENFWTTRSGILLQASLTDVVCHSRYCLKTLLHLWLGYLLYGQPGTGKSSTIHAMVMFFSRRCLTVVDWFTPPGWRTRARGIISRPCLFVRQTFIFTRSTVYP
jgi:hypothetical protein